MKPEFKINQKYLYALSKVFSPMVMDSLALKGNSRYLSEVCLKSGLLEQIDFSNTLGQFIDWIYKILFKYYRNEYIYKNVLAKNILLGKHSLNTSSMLTEFRVGYCKADVVIINGTSTVYEIKSEFDSFARLEKQVLTYLDIFDNINVITSGPQAIELKAKLPEYIGILVLTDKNTISTIRESKSNKDNINLGILFDSLRKNEYIKIIKEFYGTVPDVPNTIIYKECKGLFNNIPADIAHDLTFKILRERSDSITLKIFIEQAPRSLYAYAMSISDDKKKMEGLMSRFSLNIGSVLVT
jgi:hypothetical protein